MILIGLGANLPSAWGVPKETLNKAVVALEQTGISVITQSQYFLSTPLGRSGQGIYVNSAVQVVSHLPPEAILQRLHTIEHKAGRRRGVRWRSRELDLDLLEWHGVVRHGARATQMPGYIPLTLPHPGIENRAFVLAPLAMIAPRWHHPLSGLTPLQMLKRLRSSGQGRLLDQ
jgi:2-amino-4-hydroxy-6-hydroxymethyldihydropteridine diphosphokinase